MGTSFYWGTETQLYNGARAFSAQLSADPESFGILPEQASAYAEVAAVWAAAYEAAADPALRTKSRVIAKRDAKQLIRAATASLAKIIAGTATVSDEQKINLGLSVRSTSRTAGAPGTPGRFTIELSAIGAITLKWKCANPTAGTMYEVWRAIGDAIDRNELTYVAIVGKKRFTDETVPVGSSRVMYRVRAVRATAKGTWVSHNVNFGVSPGWAKLAAVKIAA